MRAVRFYRPHIFLFSVLVLQKKQAAPKIFGKRYYCGKLKHIIEVVLVPGISRTL